MVTLSACVAEVAPTLVAGKVSPVEGEKATVAAGGADPVMETLCGDPLAVSVAMRLAEADPAMVGLKTMERVQLAWAGSSDEQVFATRENSPAFAPCIR